LGGEESRGREGGVGSGFRRACLRGGHGERSFFLWGKGKENEEVKVVLVGEWVVGGEREEGRREEVKKELEEKERALLKLRIWRTRRQSY